MYLTVFNSQLECGAGTARSGAPTVGVAPYIEINLIPSKEITVLLIDCQFHTGNLWFHSLSLLLRPKIEEASEAEKFVQRTTQ
jgi:hypothetical protein